MEIKNFKYDTNIGFVWIMISGRFKDSRDMIVQCCLIYDPESEKYLKKIKQGDCGHDNGICGDENEKAFKDFGENRCMTALFRKAKKNGIELVN